MDAYNVIKWFDEIRKTDIALVGGKGANLGELTAASVPVPPGFCVVADAYSRFVGESGLDRKIAEALQSLDFEDTAELQARTAEIRRWILETPVPQAIEGQIRRAYEALADQLGVRDPRVAVRSSATAEDLPDASFAGQQDTYLHVIGGDDVIRCVRECWASLWNARATYYRQKQHYDHFAVSLCAVVQKMVDSEISGVMFTANPVTGERGQIMINASWGLGEAVVSGSVTPDEYVLSKDSLTELDSVIAEKKVMIVERSSGSGTVAVPVAEYLGPEWVSKRCMGAAEVRRLAEAGKTIEKLYGAPMDIEWGQDRDTKDLYILQARPVTTLKDDAPLEGGETLEGSSLTVLIRGLAASPGIARGKAIYIKSLDEIAKVQPGHILVTAMTNPDMVPAMKKAAAVVTDEGGRTCHAAIVSRELGIPCIVGSKNATQVLTDGLEITVDATRGVVYRGNVSLSSDEDKHSPVAPGAASPAQVYESAPVTGTKIYMNLGDASIIGKYNHLPFDGIGLMRTEFIFSHVGIHPMYLLQTGRGQVLIEEMSQAITTVAQAIYPRPLVVRLSDFRTNEFRGLEGGEVEPEENNPMIGWRGVSRYISPAYEEGFRLECKAIKKVRDDFGLINVWVMLPFVRTTWEVRRVKEIMASEGLIQNKSFKIWIMAEVPAVVFQAEEFATLVDGFSIGSNDLTQLVMGVDRDSAILNNMGYFDERDPAVQSAISSLIQAAHRRGITCSICGQGPSLYPDFAEFLVRQGIDSISVNPDTVAYTRRLVAAVEQRIILQGISRLSSQE